MSKLPSNASLFYLLPFLLIFLPFSVKFQTTDYQILVDQLKQQWKSASLVDSLWDPSTERHRCNGTGVFCSDAGLTKQIHPSICNPRNLTYLDLSLTNLVGRISDGVDRLPIDLMDVNLSGEIPTSVGNLPGGEVPDWFWSLKNLSMVMASNKLFSGELPDKLLLNLSRLEMNNNSFSGTIPWNIMYLTNLFYGKISSNLTALPQLSAETLSSVSLATPNSSKNQPFPEIPSELDFMESNIFSNLTENNVIGSGRSGVVYRVSVTRPGAAYVAVKKFRSKAKLNQNLEKEFLAEIEILGALRHFNIVKLLWAITKEKSKFLVYEYMENHSLDRWLHSKNNASLASGSIHYSMLEWPTRMKIAIGIAQGLSYMHHSNTRPIIHGDVKSSNILLDSEFNAKIADFGLARMLNKEGEPDTVYALADTYEYIVPEYAHSTMVNEKIDVYSFGVVLLELVTGKEAKDGEEHGCLAEQVRWSHIQDGNPIQSALDEKVMEPRNLEDMCMVFKLGLMCTAELPSTRPSMKEVLQTLLWHRTSSEMKNQNEDDDATPLLNATKEGCRSHKIGTATIVR